MPNKILIELESEDLKKSELLTNISHDIRTPLTTILGYIDMIQTGKYSSEEERSKYIGIIKNKGQFLARIMDDFFQYSKLESKDIAMKQESLELNELARQLFEDEENQFMRKTLKLSLDLSKEPITICGDSEMTIRAINNILNNALKYSRPYTAVKIKIAQEKLNDVSYGTFSLINIPKEAIYQKDVERLFERTYKRDTARSEEGSGLGLSIVKSIVRLNNGFIKGSANGECVIFKLGFKLLDKSKYWNESSCNKR